MSLLQEEIASIKSCNLCGETCIPVVHKSFPSSCLVCLIVPSPEIIDTRLGRFSFSQCKVKLSSLCANSLGIRLEDITVIPLASCHTRGRNFRQMIARCKSNFFLLSSSMPAYSVFIHLGSFDEYSFLFSVPRHKQKGSFLCVKHNERYHVSIPCVSMLQRGGSSLLSFIEAFSATSRLLRIQQESLASSVFGPSKRVNVFSGSTSFFAKDIIEKRLQWEEGHLASLIKSPQKNRTRKTNSGYSVNYGDD